MSRTLPTVVSRLVAVTLLLVVFAAPALAWATEADTESTTTAAPSDPGASEPAVEAPPAEEEAEDVPWTTTFLAPATLILGLLGVVGVAAYYGARVASKYRVG